MLFYIFTNLTVMIYSLLYFSTVYIYSFIFLKYFSLLLLFILTVIQLCRLDDVCCLFYKHATSRLYDRSMYLCSMKLTFKIVSYDVRNGQMAARLDVHVRV